MTRPEAARDALDLLVRKESPFNAEPPLARLVESWITPVERLYVRNHAPAPTLDPGTWSLEVDGLVERTVSFDLDELRGLPQIEVTATMQCAGNRRDEHSAVRPVDGVAWGAGAIGHCVWRGPRLRDVLAPAGLSDRARHVELVGLDRVEKTGDVFAGSIPRVKATAPETILALEMNGAPLTADHGFPARAVVPGFIGARSVKWLGRITATAEPSANHFQAVAYKVAPPDATLESAEWPAIPPLDELPLNAVVCDPSPGDVLAAGLAGVRGYAVAPGLPGRTVARVQVSGDGGATWNDAQFASPVRPFAWCLWEAAVELACGETDIVVRAWDSSGALQPPDTPWNVKGYLYNGWHRVRVTVG